MSQAPSLPRFSLALVALVHAGVFGWAGYALPWGGPTLFAAACAALGSLYLLLVALALVGSRYRAHVWRLTAVLSLAFLAYNTWMVFDAATYIAVLYGGLGRGVAAGLGAAWAVLVLFTLPTSVWGIVATGGIRRPRITAAGAGAAALLVTISLWRSASAAEGTPLPTIAASPEALLPELEAIAASLPPLGDRVTPSLLTREPVRCEQAPEVAGATAVISFLRTTAPPDPEPFRPTTVCVQAEPDALLAAIRGTLKEAAARGPMKIDVLTQVAPLTSAIAAPDIFQIRPGIDGLCRLGRCLMPWQLVALDQFTTNRPLDFIDDLRFGVDSRGLMAIFSGGEPPEERPALDGLTRITTWSLMLDANGTPRSIPRLRDQELPLTERTLSRALILAERHILHAQAPDGRFRYLLDPYSGAVSWRGFAVPRQAGTTLALCEVGTPREEVRQAVRKSLAMLTSIEEQVGDLGAIAPRRGNKPPPATGLGNTALSMIALLSCRDRVGPEFDAAIGRLGRFLLTMMREDGGFYPAYHLKEDHVIEGPDPLYAGGQAVFALSLLEAAAAADPEAPFPPAEELREAVERAMEYTARHYWGHGLYDFFFLEENWHCLAARASLGHHRNANYERFCLDYVTYKSRLIFDEASEVSPDLVGAYGFGNVIPPHNTPTGGFGETLAAAMAIRAADGDDLTDDRALMARVLTFLVRQQWRPELCFACDPEQVIAGGWSESLASPVIRIDYTQHCMAALGHGGRLLDLPLGAPR
ncbi:MAG: hypothetical protein KC486_04950 [Myxococcales bacterium]|nr:hypothetical protein [Myxococcales bacterium]